MRGGWRVGSIAGIDLRVDGSWTIVALLVGYSFYLELTEAYPELSGLAGTSLAIGSAAVFFGSVLVHEMAHALLARRRGIEVKGITLFLFGGATHARIDSQGARDEFAVAGIGPVTSMALAGVLAAIALGAEDLLPRSVAGALLFLAWLNLLLGVFNLLPGFPLDGGRLLRSTIWSRTGSLPKATRIASIAGQVVGGLMVAAGVLLALTERVGSGIWLAAIGWFLAQAARMSLEAMRSRALLEGFEAGDLMDPLDGVAPRPLPPLVDEEAPATDVLTELNERAARRVLVTRGGETIGVVTHAGLRRWLADRKAAGT